MGRQEGGLGILDYRALDEAAVVQEAINLWESNGSTWSAWMNQHYVRAQSFVAIRSKQGDSSGWKELIRAKDSINKCMGLGPNGAID